MLLNAILVALAYFVADFASSLYHLATDAGFNTKRIVGQFLKHHNDPGSMTFDLEPVMAGVPVSLIGLLWLPWFFVPLGLFVSMAQIPHYYTHHKAPRIVSALQKCGIFLSVKAHEKHHGSPHDCNFSVVNGWSNPLVNWMAKEMTAKKALVAVSAMVFIAARFLTEPQGVQRADISKDLTHLFVGGCFGAGFKSGDKSYVYIATVMTVAEVVAAVLIKP
jgi:hypothetical protein